MGICRHQIQDCYVSKGQIMYEDDYVSALNVLGRVLNLKELNFDEMDTCQLQLATPYPVSVRIDRDRQCLVLAGIVAPDLPNDIEALTDIFLDMVGEFIKRGGSMLARSPANDAIYLYQFFPVEGIEKSIEALLEDFFDLYASVGQALESVGDTAHGTDNILK